MFKIYTDGSCLGNPGPGGWGVVIANVCSEILVELSNFDENTTNNRMELTAAIEGLKWLDSQENNPEAELYTDSTYVKDGLTKWLEGWKKRNWKTSKKEPVKNQDLWIELDQLYQKLSVKFHWVKAHVGHELNERADTLAYQSALHKKKVNPQAPSSSSSAQRDSIQQERICLFDLETTGFSPDHGHRAIEIGIVEVIDRKITQKTFHQYLNPERSIDQGAQRVHGLSREFLSDKPLFGDIVEPLLEFIEGSIMIAHNASFDESFLNMELKRVGLGPLKNYCLKIEDSLALARSLYPGKKNSLDALCQRLEISNSHRQYHGALLDSELLAQVYLAMTGGQQTLSFDQVHENTEKNKISENYKNIQVASMTDHELKSHEKWCDNHSQEGKECLFHLLK